MHEHSVRLNDGAVVTARTFPAGVTARGAILILAHGAGAGQAHPFMVDMAEGLARRGVTVVTFDFPYMAARRRLPDRAPVLESCFLDVIRQVRARDPEAVLVIGGKSLGGRMASHVGAHHATAAGPLAGLVLLGYPLHPPGRRAAGRAAHLPLVRVPMLFVQGGADPFGTPAELAPVLQTLRAPATLHEVPGATHSFEVPRRGGVTQAQVNAGVQDAVATWILHVSSAHLDRS
jgi:uncharacterized protein